MSRDHIGKIWIVTKSDAHMDAPYVVGAFLDESKVDDACKGPGTFLVAMVDPNRAYARGTMLDVRVVENATLASVKTRPRTPYLARSCFRG